MTLIGEGHGAGRGAPDSLNQEITCLAILYEQLRGEQAARSDIDRGNQVAESIKEGEKTETKTFPVRGLVATPWRP
jgi:hypothetical protein